MNVPYYLESHITIEPVLDGSKLEVVHFIARTYSFRVADLLMQKREEDTPERSKFDTFMTSHSTSLEVIEFNTKECIKTLQQFGFKVWRYKIENIVCDSRNEDIWKLL